MGACANCYSHPLAVASPWTPLGRAELPTHSLPEQEEAAVTVATASLWQGGCQRPPCLWQSGRRRQTLVEVPKSGDQEALAGMCN